MFHTVIAVEPMPMAFPTAEAAVPVSTSASRTAATSSSSTRVTSSWTGRSFHTGRPSPTSYIRFMARLNAPT